MAEFVTIVHYEIETYYYRASYFHRGNQSLQKLACDLSLCFLNKGSTHFDFFYVDSLQLLSPWATQKLGILGFSMFLHDQPLNERIFFLIFKTPLKRR